MASILDASRCSWCLVVEHLYEVAWRSYEESGAIHPSVRIALEEIIKVDAVADMLSELSTEIDVIAKMQQQVIDVDELPLQARLSSFGCAPCFCELCNFCS